MGGPTLRPMPPYEVELVELGEVSANEGTELETNLYLTSAVLGL